MNKVFVFGTNALAQLLAYYLESNKAQFDGLVLNKEYISCNRYENLELYAIEDMIEEYGNDSISVYIATAYSNMNNVRKSVFNWLKNEGISVLSFIHPSAIIAENVEMGIGNIVLENSNIQPFVHLGDANIIWNNVTLCHHCNIGSYNYISPAATVTGRVSIGSNNFIGANSTIKSDTSIGDEVLIGAGAYVNRNLGDKSVLLPSKSVLVEGKISSDIYLR